MDKSIISSNLGNWIPKGDPITNSCRFQNLELRLTQTQTRPTHSFTGTHARAKGYSIRWTVWQCPISWYGDGFRSLRKQNLLVLLLLLPWSGKEGAWDLGIFAPSSTSTPKFSDPRNTHFFKPSKRLVPISFLLVFFPFMVHYLLFLDLLVFGWFFF